VELMALGCATQILRGQATKGQECEKIEYYPDDAGDPDAEDDHEGHPPTVMDLPQVTAAMPGRLGIACSPGQHGKRRQPSINSSRWSQSSSRSRNNRPLSSSITLPGTLNIMLLGQGRRSRGMRIVRVSA
jgi:hypothetical protein